MGLGESHSARVIKGNAAQLNYSERDGLCNVSVVNLMLYFHTDITLCTHACITNLSRRMCRALSEVFVYCFNLVAVG